MQAGGEKTVPGTSLLHEFILTVIPALLTCENFPTKHYQPHLAFVNKVEVRCSTIKKCIKVHFYLEQDQNLLKS